LALLARDQQERIHALETTLAVVREERDALRTQLNACCLQRDALQIALKRRGEAASLPDEAYAGIYAEHQRDHEDGPQEPREGCLGCRLLAEIARLRSEVARLGPAPGAAPAWPTIPPQWNTGRESFVAVPPPEAASASERPTGPICASCGKKPSVDPSVVLSRANVKGIPGVWLCQWCLHKEPPAGLVVPREELEAIREILEFIAGGHTIPGYKGPHQDERVALLQEVVHGAQTKAKEAVARLAARLAEGT
jgi:hypothetical protein